MTNSHDVQEEATHVMTMSLVGVPAPVNVRVVMQVGCMAMVGCEVLIYAKAIARRRRRMRGAFGVQ